MDVFTQALVIPGGDTLRDGDGQFGEFIVFRVTADDGDRLRRAAAAQTAAGKEAHQQAAAHAQHDTQQQTAQIDELFFHLEPRYCHT